MSYSQHYFKTGASDNEEQQYESETQAIRDAMTQAGKSEDEINLVLNNPRLRAAKLMAGRAAEKYGKPVEEIKGNSARAQYGL